MIGYLKGQVISLQGGTAIILCGGVGYEVLLSGAAEKALTVNSEGEVYTYLQTRDDGIFLYGFASPEEKNMFLQLISVSGVGPKGGIGILSQMTIDRLVLAIATSDVKALTNVKGLGKKTAERIILELREKVGGGGDIGEDGNAGLTDAGEGNEDAIVALMTLGFTRAESTAAVNRARAAGASTVEEIIMAALKSL